MDADQGTQVVSIPVDKVRALCLALPRVASYVSIPVDKVRARRKVIGRVNLLVLFQSPWIRFAQGSRPPTAKEVKRFNPRG